MNGYYHTANGGEGIEGLDINENQPLAHNNRDFENDYYNLHIEEQLIHYRNDGHYRYRQYTSHEIS